MSYFANAIFGAGKYVKNTYFPPKPKLDEKRTFETAVFEAQKYYGKSWDTVPMEGKQKAIQHFAEEIKKKTPLTDVPNAMPRLPDSQISAGKKSYFSSGIAGAQPNMSDIAAQLPSAFARMTKDAATVEPDSVRGKEIAGLKAKQAEADGFWERRRIGGEIFREQRNEFGESLAKGGYAATNSMVRGTPAAIGQVVGQIDEQMNALTDKLYSFMGKEWGVPVKPDTEGANKPRVALLAWAEREQIKLDSDNRIIIKGADMKLGEIAGSGIASVFLAGGLGLVAKSAKASALFLSMAESQNTYLEAVKSGKSPLAALTIAGVSGIGTYKLEKMGFDHLLESQPGFLLPFVNKSLFEGGQELTQQAWQNSISKFGYDNAKSIWEGAFESFVGGVFGGGAGGISVAVFEQTEKGKEILTELRKSGLNKEQAQVVFRDIGRAVQESYGKFMRGMRAGGEELSKPGDTNLSMFGAGEGRRLYDAGRAFGNEFFGERWTVNLYAGENAKGFGQASGKQSFLTDKKARFEIDDSGARLKGQAIELEKLQKFNIKTLFGMKLEFMKPIETYVGSILDHPQLFENYPRLEGLPVTIYPSSGLAKDKIASYNPSDGVGSINIYLDGGGLTVDTLLHEIQHFVQQSEGFATGGVPGMPTEAYSEANAKLNEAKKELESAKEAGLTGESMKKYEEEYQEQAKILKNFPKKERYVTKREYQRLAGEVEARDVSTRKNMTAQERISNTPLGSQKIPLKDQNVIFDSRGRMDQSKGRAEVDSNEKKEQDGANATSTRNNAGIEEISTIESGGVRKVDRSTESGGRETERAGGELLGDARERSEPHVTNQRKDLGQLVEMYGLDEVRVKRLLEQEDPERWLDQEIADAFVVAPRLLERGEKITRVKADLKSLLSTDNNKSEQKPDTENTKPERVTPKKQVELNNAARAILAEKTDDEITDADKEILRQYSGAGGLEKVGESGRGLLDEYYTPKVVVEKMWALAKKWGAVGGDVLEPSVGIGRFLENAPEWAKKITGIELDATSARIVKLLHPQAEILNQPFEKFFVDPETKKPISKDIRKKFRVVIGNPPYGQHRGANKFLDEPKINRYEEYFIKRGVDLLSDGGLLVYIVPSSFLRSGATKAKDTILKNAKLLEAYRLPNRIFGTTDIGTDIIVLQKQDSGAWGLDPNRGMVTYGSDKKESRGDIAGDRTKQLSDDAYFEQNPEKILGEKTVGKDRYGKEIEVIKGDMSVLSDIDMTRSLLPKLNEGRLKYSLKYAKSNEDFLARLAKDYPIQYPVRFRETVVGSPEELLREMKAGGMGMRLHSQAEVDFEKTENAKIEQSKLKTRGRADVIIENTNTAPVGRNKKYAKDISELEEKIWDARDFDGSITDDSIPREYLNFADGKWYSDWDYYSGKISDKIEQAKKDMSDSGEARRTKIERQIEKLTNILPEPKTVMEIYMSPLAPLANEKNGNGDSLVSMFVEWLEDLPRDAFAGSAKWEVAEFVRGIPQTGKSKEENAAIRQRRREVGESLFRRFYALHLPDHVRDDFEARYNRQFNSTIEPDYSKMPFRAEGLSDTFRGRELTLRQHQLEAISFIKHKGRGILAHDVGFGKTMEGIVAIHEMMQKGWAKRPLVVVPNLMYKKWIEEIQGLYPNTKIVGLDNLGVEMKLSDDFAIKEGELTIIKYSAMEKLTFGKEEEERLRGDLQDTLADLSGKKKTKRQEELDRAKDDEVWGKSNTKGVYNFEDFGFDAVLVDELHNFKNIFTSARSDKGRGDGGGAETKSEMPGPSAKKANEFSAVSGSSSARGVKMYLIAQHILRNNNGRNFVGLTATPFSNSPIEIYNMLSLVARDEMRAAGLENLNNFVATFMEMKNTFIVKPGGNMLPGMVVENFRNVAALQAIVRRYIDFKAADDSPEMVKARPEKRVINHTLFPNQQQIMLLKAAEKKAAKGGKNGELLVAINDMRMATLSPYFAEGESLPSAKEFVENSPKIYATMRMIAENKKGGQGSGQIIYMPMGVEALGLLNEYLVNEIGYKSSEVGIISGDVTIDQREVVKEAFDEGTIKVVIGTNTIMEGVDLQGNSTDMYILSLPWKPTELQQLHGRLWRQGNRWKTVRIHNLLLADTIDSFMSQKLEEKTKRLQNIWSFKGDTLPNDEIDFEQEKMNLIRDPIKRLEIERLTVGAANKARIDALRAEKATMGSKSTKYEKAKEEVQSATQALANLKRHEDTNWGRSRISEEKSRLKKAQEIIKATEERKDFAQIVEGVSRIAKELEELEEAQTKTNEDFEKRAAELADIEIPEWESRENKYSEFAELIRKDNEDFFVAHEEYSRKQKKSPALERQPAQKEVVPAPKPEKTLAPQSNERVAQAETKDIGDVIMLLASEEIRAMKEAEQEANIAAFLKERAAEAGEDSGMFEMVRDFRWATQNIEAALGRLSGLSADITIPQDILANVAAQYLKYDTELGRLRRQINSLKTNREQRDAGKLLLPEIRALESKKRMLTSKTQMRKIAELASAVAELSAVKKEVADYRESVKNVLGSRSGFEQMGTGTSIGKSDADWWHFVLQDYPKESAKVDILVSAQAEIERLDFSFFNNYERQIREYIAAERKRQTDERLTQTRSETARETDSSGEEGGGEEASSTGRIEGDRPDVEEDVPAKRDVRLVVPEKNQQESRQISEKDARYFRKRAEHLIRTHGMSRHEAREYMEENGYALERDYLVAGERNTPDTLRRFLQEEAEYQRYMEQKEKAYVLSQDKIRESFPDYAPSRSDDFTAEVRPLAFAQFQQAIKNDKTGKARFTGGGSASGKTEVALKPLLDTEGVIIDTTLANSEHSLENVQIALDAGKQVTIHAVYTPFADAYEFAFQRSARDVPDKDMVRTHAGFRQTMVELARQHQENQNVSFVLIENGKGMEGAIPERLANKDFLAYAEKNLHNTDDLFQIINEKRREMDASNQNTRRRDGDTSASGSTDRQQRVEEGGDQGARDAEEQGAAPELVYGGGLSPDEIRTKIAYEGGDISAIVGEVKPELAAIVDTGKKEVSVFRQEREKEAFDDLAEMPPPNSSGGDAAAQMGYKDKTRRDIDFIHDLVGQAHDIYMTDPKEFAPVKEFEKAADNRRMEKSALDEDFAKILGKYYELKKEEKAEVNRILVMGDKEGKVYNKETLVAEGLTDREITGYYSIRRSFDKAQDVLIEKMKEAGIKKEEIEEFKHRMAGYIPHRWQYRFVVKTRKLMRNRNQDTGEIYEYTVTESMADFKTIKQARAAAEKLLLQNKNSDYSYEVDTLDSLDVYFFQDQNLSRDKVMGLLETVKTSDEIKLFMQESIKDLFKEKGFGQHYFRRSNVKGYDVDNLEKHIADYFSGFSGYVTKMQAAPKYFEALSEVDPRRQKKLHKWLRHTIAYDMGNTYEFNSIKQIGFIYFLANDLSFLAVNMTQNYIMGTAELSKIMEGVDKLVRPEKEILRAQVNWATKKGVNEEEQAVITAMLHAGRLGGEMTAELMGFHNNPLYRELTGAAKKALFASTAFVEQNVNRVPMFLAARRVLEGTKEFSDLAVLRNEARNGRNKKVREEAQSALDERLSDLNYEAFQIEENVHFRYGKQHRAKFQRGIGGVSFLFMHYMRSFVWSMARDMKGNEFASLARKMLYTFVLGGAVALPFAKTLIKVYEEIMNAFGWWDDDEEKEKEMTFWSTAFERGLPAAMGVDLSGRVSIDIFMLSNMMERPEKLNEVTAWLGAVGGLWNREKTAFNLLKEGRYIESMGKAMPDILANPIRAFYGYKYGVFSQYGNPLTDADGFPVKYSMSEAIIRGIGFTPTREAILWEQRARESQTKDKQKEVSDGYRAKIRHALVQGDIEGAKSIERDAAEMGDINPENSYIRDWVKEQAGIGSVASAEGITRFVRLNDDQRQLYLEQSSESHKDELEKWLYAMDHPGAVDETAEDAFYDWYDEKYDKAPSRSTINTQMRRNLEVQLVAEGETLASFFYERAKESGKQPVEIAVQMRALKKDNKLTMDDIKEYAELSGGNLDNIRQFVEMNDEEIEERFPDLVLP